eukprot:579203-Prorocentrum_minimum.AAC.3
MEGLFARPHWASKTSNNEQPSSSGHPPVSCWKVRPNLSKSLSNLAECTYKHKLLRLKNSTATQATPLSICQAAATSVAPTSPREDPTTRPARPPYIQIKASNIFVVDSSEMLQRASTALFDYSKEQTEGDYPASGLHLVGLDCEWLPYSGTEPETPVAVLQVVTRTEAFLIDMLFWSRPWGGEVKVVDADSGREWSDFEPFAELTDREREVNAFLAKLFTSQRITRVGFMFGFDLFRLQRSYPHLPVFKPGSEAGPGQTPFVVEILDMARFAMPQVPKFAVSLAKLVDIVINMYAPILTAPTDPSPIALIRVPPLQSHAAQQPHL